VQKEKNIPLLSQSEKSENIFALTNNFCTNPFLSQATNFSWHYDFAAQGTYKKNYPRVTTRTDKVCGAQNVAVLLLYTGTKKHL